MAPNTKRTDNEKRQLIAGYRSAVKRVEWVRSLGISPGAIYRWARELGIDLWAPAPRAVNATPDAQWRQKWARDRYWAHKLAGICVHQTCKDPPAPDELRCERHLAIWRKGSRAWQHSARGREVQRYHLRKRSNQRREAGLCVKCGAEELATETLCQKCRAYYSAYWQKHANPKRKRRPCGTCGELGHNRISCPKRGLDNSIPLEIIATNRKSTE